MIEVLSVRVNGVLYAPALVWRAGPPTEPGLYHVEIVGLSGQKEPRLADVLEAHDGDNGWLSLWLTGETRPLPVDRALRHCPIPEPVEAPCG